MSEPEYQNLSQRLREALRAIRSDRNNGRPKNPELYAELDKLIDEKIFDVTPEGSGSDGHQED